MTILDLGSATEVFWWSSRRGLQTLIHDGEGPRSLAELRAAPAGGWGNPGSGTSPAPNRQEASLAAGTSHDCPRPAVAINVQPPSPRRVLRCLFASILASWLPNGRAGIDRGRSQDQSPEPAWNNENRNRYLPILSFPWPVSSACSQLDCTTWGNQHLHHRLMR